MLGVVLPSPTRVLKVYHFHDEPLNPAIVGVLKQHTVFSWPIIGEGRRAAKFK